MDGDTELMTVPSQRSSKSCPSSTDEHGIGVQDNKEELEHITSLFSTSEEDIDVLVRTKDMDISLGRMSLAVTPGRDFGLLHDDYANADDDYFCGGNQDIDIEPVNNINDPIGTSISSSNSNDEERDDKGKNKLITGKLINY